MQDHIIGGIFRIASISRRCQYAFCAHANQRVVHCQHRPLAQVPADTAIFQIPVADHIGCALGFPECLTAIVGAVGYHVVIVGVAGGIHRCTTGFQSGVAFYIALDTQACFAFILVKVVIAAGGNGCAFDG